MDSPREQGKFNLNEVVNEHNEPIMVFGGVASTEEVSTVSDIVIDTLTDTESENQPSKSTSTSSQNNPSEEQASSSNQNPVPSNDVYNFNENFELPPFLNGFASTPSSSDNNSENDQIDYLLESDDDNNQEEVVGEIPQIKVLLENYRRDLEHKFDFSNNWTWTEEDPGASSGPFNGNPGLNIQPDSNDPIDFF